MAFTVTARGSGNSGESNQQTRASSSATPTANSLYITGWGQENNASATAPAYQTPTGGGLTYTQVGTAGAAGDQSYAWDGDDSFRVGTAVYRSDIGGSPSATVTTVDSSSTTATFYYGLVCFDITGHDVASPIVDWNFTGASKSQGNTETGTIVIDWTPAVGELICVVFTAGADGGGGFASPTVGSGKTFQTITNQNASFCQTGVFYRVWDGSEPTTTITCSDLGQTVGNYSAVVFGVKAAAGSGSNFTQTPADTEGLTDATAQAVGKVIGETEGLTDATAFARGLAVPDALGLTDVATTALGRAVAGADTLGLTDAALIEKALTRSQSDTEGLTDTAALAVGYAQARADTEGLADSAALAFNRASTASDAVGLTDAASVQLSTSGSLSPADTEGLTDSTSLARGQVATDPVGVTDSTTVQLSGAGAINAADTEGLADATAISQQKTAAEIEGITDSVSVILTRDLGDAVAVSDLADITALFARVLSDVTSVSDAADVALNPTEVVIPDEVEATPRPYTSTTTLGGAVSTATARAYESTATVRSPE